MNNKMYTKQDILNQLNAMRAPTDSIVLMHSSLRSIGQVEGGAKTLLDAFIEHFTKDGGLFCVPTHTGQNVDKDITLDMSSFETSLGAFAEVALLDGRGIRSENPILSMVVFGDREKAEAFIADEPFITSITAPNSCYGKIYSQGGYILLVGVAQKKTLICIV